MMLLAFPIDRQSDDERKARVQGYLMAVAGEPDDAVAAVCAAVIRGEVASIDRRFAPTPAQLGDLVRGKTRPLVEALEDLRIIATSSVLDASAFETKQFMVDGFSDLRSELAARGEARRAETSRRFLADLDVANEKMRIRDCQKAGVDPALGVTPTLLRLLKEKPIA